MDAASSANFPYDYTPQGFNFMNDQAEKTDLVKNVDYTEYQEGIYVGYRYFDTKGINVSYPFGFGLSYTTFEYSNPEIAESNGSYTAKISVKNTGLAAGKEVVQLYVSAPKSEMDKPVKELKAYVKTRLLQPGESQVVELHFTADDLASFDEKSNKWLIEKGLYTAHFAASSKEIRQSCDFQAL